MFPNKRHSILQEACNAWMWSECRNYYQTVHGRWMQTRFLNVSDITKTILAMWSLLKHNLVQFCLLPHGHLPIQEDTVPQIALSRCFFKLRTWLNFFLLKLGTITKCLKGSFQFQADVLLKVEHLPESRGMRPGFRYWRFLCPLNSCPTTGYPRDPNFH